MTDVIQTYPVSIPSVALAMMAANLAHLRIVGLPLVERSAWTPYERKYLDRNTPNSREYYRIIDRISRGEQP